MMHALRSDQLPLASGVSLDQLLADATRTGSGAVVAHSCTSDWREVQPGDVYVALPELSAEDENGHQYAVEAAARGAAAIICEEPVPVFDIPTYLVTDSRVAWGRLCQALSGNPAQDLRVIAVTGTHGKSTVLALLEAIFTMAGKHCGKLTGLGCYDGMAFGAGIEVPTAPELAYRLERMVAAGCTHALIEVSSEALSQAAFAGVEFDTALITNVTDAHLRLHNSIQSYRNLKKRILDHLSPTGLAVFNADDPVSSTWLTHWDGPVITIGTKGQAEISGNLVSQYSNEQVFTITAGSETVAVRTPMLGEHHLSNCLAAAAIALAHGIDLQLVAAGIETVESLPGRMERVDCGQGFPVFVDAADTAESLRACLRTARQMCDGRVICVLGEPKQATYSEQLAVAHVVNRLAHVVITARDLPIEECNYRDSLHRTLIETVEDRYEAISRAIEMACPGDVVVIAGSRHEPQRAFGMIGGEEERGDAATARLLLYARTQLTHLRVVA